jgi:hypothetical protein
MKKTAMMAICLSLCCPVNLAWGETDLKQPIKIAESGDAGTQFDLVNIYRKSEGVSQNYAEAVKWFRKSADQGHVVSQHNLASMYAHGEGVPKDYSEAVKWYRKAADQGLSVSQYALGIRYYLGQGVSQDYTEAIKWFKKAADQENSDAQLYLGHMYNHGQGVPKNFTEAIKWYKKATDQGYTEAGLYLDALCNIQSTSLNDSVLSKVSGKSETKEVKETKLISAPDGILPGRYSIYLHYSGEESKNLMGELSIFLKNKGFEVTGIERFNYKNRDIRYFHNEDKSGALLLHKNLTDFITCHTNFKHTDIKIFNLSHKYPNAKKGALELWVTF